MRRKYIIDPKFQWTIVAYSLGVSIATTLCHITIEKLATFEQFQIAAGYGGNFFGPKGAMIALEIFLMVGIFVISILFSNRLAGPIYRMRRHMDDFAQGKTVPPLKFRKEDYFSELEDSYNRLINAKQNKSGGFTIMELMVALTIGMAAAMISVVFLTNSKPEIEFSKDIANLEAVLMAARNAAMTKNECAIVSRLNAQTISASSYAMSKPCALDPLPTPDFTVTRNFSATSSLSSFSTGATMTFVPGGGTNHQDPVTITLSSTIGKQSTFTVYPAIGQVRHQ